MTTDLIYLTFLFAKRSDSPLLASQRKTVPTSLPHTLQEQNSQLKMQIILKEF
jgi:hypothetical protein